MPLSKTSESSTVLDERSKYLRREILGMLKAARRGHLGSAFSLIEILRVLYDEVLQYDVSDPKWSGRDRFILSKGHGCLALYAILADKGFISRSELKKFCSFEAMLGGHPNHKTPGVEFSTGSLGHGLSIGIGCALHAKYEHAANRVYVVVGDGESNEGTIWEGALSAGKHQLDNLTVMIDCNKYQSYGQTENVQNLEPLADKWRSFGFHVVEVDGHDVFALKDACSELPKIKNKPSLVICHTVKGRGIPFAESNPAWHHKSKISDVEMQTLFQGLANSR
ncbi:MAG: transketolase [Nitrospirales bacterium]